jgi:ABC-type transporter Mla MlaB component
MSSDALRRLNEMVAGAPRTITLVVRGPIRRTDLPALSERVCSLFASNRGCIVHCDVTDAQPDAVTVEALARLQLVARRNECRVILRNASDKLRELVVLIGLKDVLLPQL